jgi:hypothetical protein
VEKKKKKKQKKHLMGITWIKGLHGPACLPAGRLRNLYMLLSM